eukprot:gene1431-biopygen1181
METIISKHNKKVVNTNNNTPSDRTCNCQKKEQCPLDNNCLTTSIIYNAHITTNGDMMGKYYIGLTEGTFKKRYTQHKQSFRNCKYAKSTELSKYIWDLKDKNKDYDMQWDNRHLSTSLQQHLKKALRTLKQITGRARRSDVVIECKGVIIEMT